MNSKDFFKWFYTKGSNYNLFMLEENDYDEDDNNVKDPSIVIKHQKYKTWLYVVLLAVCLYLLFYITLIRTETETVIISDITPEIYNELSFEHGQTLSCPCTSTIIPYKNFVFNNILMHPLCSSDFVNKELIEGLYFANASLYGVWDFRTTAFSQFQLLSTFCSLSKEIIAQIQTDLNNTDFVTLELLSETYVHLQLDGTVALQKSNAFGRILLFINYLRTTIQENYFATGLGTNWLVEIAYFSPGIDTTKGAQVKVDAPSPIPPLCSTKNLIIAATLPSLPNLAINYPRRLRLRPMANSTVVKGFFTGCTPLEALLQSTLDCLYDMACLQLLSNYFPNLNQTNVNWSISILPSKHENITVLNYLNTLFIDNWSIEMNYSTYFHQCSPSKCTYTRKDRVAISYSIALFISLYGGLTIILRLVASYFIVIISKLKLIFNKKSFCNTDNQNMSIFKSMKRLNLFKNVHDRTEDSINQQRIITRTYLVLLLGSICFLCLYTILSNEVVTITVLNPSLTVYNSLASISSITLQCPCSNKTIAHRIFLSFSPILHQICSSGFVHEDWIGILAVSTNERISSDWRNEAHKHFRVLSDLCHLANKTIYDGIDEFLSQIFIASSIMNERDFSEQFNVTVNQFYQSTVYDFNLLKDIVRLVMQVDQLYSGSFVFMLHNPDTKQIVKILSNGTNNNKTRQIQFIPNGMQEINSTSITCVCTIDPHCQSQAVIYDGQYKYDWNNDINLIYNITGWIQGCLSIDSVLLSTLQCLYVDSNCFPLLMSNLYKINYFLLDPRSSPVRIQPLIYDQAMSRFPPNTSTSIIIEQLMIENWNPSSSYQHFYKACAPKYCSYSQKVRKENFIGVIVTLVSMIGGIVVVLRILTPHIIKFFLTFSTMFRGKPAQKEQIHRSHIDRLKILMKNVIKLIHTTLIELNIFTARDLGSTVDRVTAKRYGQWATRLYIVLFLSTLSILIFYTIFQPHIVIKTFDRPSFIYYNHLKEIYRNQLKCTCSRIASQYIQFVKIEPIFHPICTSEFISEEWRLNLVNDLVSNLSIYDQKDYRRIISAHLQYIQGLCRISIESANNSINEFLTTLFITVDLSSEIDFQNRLYVLIEQCKDTAPILFSRLLSSTGSVFHGNTFISMYGTNFEYKSLYDGTQYLYAYTVPIIYDEKCSCVLSSRCTTQATFIETNTSMTIPIKGMKMGCTPSESFLASTLECFYDQSCLDLIQQYTNYEKSLTPLSTTNFHRFLPNTTIRDLSMNSFIESWSTQMNYPSYFERCSPSLCSYSTIENFNIFYTITVILGLHGGLTIVLKWICPKLVRIAAKLHRQRTVSVHPDNHIQVSSHVTSNTIVPNTTWNCEMRPINIQPQTNVIPHNQSFLKRIFLIVLLVCILLGIIIFSIFYARQDSIVNVSLVDSLNTTISTTMSTSSNTAEPLCYPTFQRLSSDMSCEFIDLGLYVIVDINSDNRVDIVFFCKRNWIVYVLYGNADGTFRNTMIISSQVDEYIQQMFVHDMNNDDRMDLILVSSDHILILYGYGNGTFDTQTIQSLAISYTLRQITILDINGDNKLDIIFIIQFKDYIYVYLANFNGTYTLDFTLFIEHQSNPTGLFVTDFNNDTYLDIALMNANSLHIHIFYANGNGSYQTQRWFYTADDAEQASVMVDDFDGNNKMDIAVWYSSTYINYILYRDNNGTLVDEHFIINSSIQFHSINTAYLNGDNYLDIVIGATSLYQIHVLLGDGNGQFQIQTIYSSETSISAIRIDVVDLNNDNCQDLISMTDETNTVDTFLNTCECSTR